MQKKLKLPTYRRVAGGLLITSGYVVGVGLIVMSAFFKIDGIYDSAAFPFELSASTLGIFIVVAASVISPSIFYPCLFDRFPKWFDKLPRQMVTIFAQMLGAR
jgi:hypothetical protein